MPAEDLPFVLPPDPNDGEKGRISFHSEEVNFSLQKDTLLAQWIKTIIDHEQCQLDQLNFIFCSDTYLHQINIKYLQHDTFTDIITFPYHPPPIIHGDIYISIDRVKENAHQLNIAFSNELHRVIIHGVLHLCGYGDKTPDEKKYMTKKENEALKLFP